MTLLTNDPTGAAWKVDGSAPTTAEILINSTASIGDFVFISAALSGSDLTPDDLTKAIENIAAPGGSLLLYESTAESDTARNDTGNEYWLRFQYRSLTTDTLDSSDQGKAKRLMDVNGTTGTASPARVILQHGFSHQDGSDQTESVVGGYSLYAQRFSGGGSHFNIHQSVAGGAPVIAQHGEWMLHDILILSANPGIVACFANGVLVGEANQTQDYTSGSLVLTGSDFFLGNLSLAAGSTTAHVKDQFAPPLESQSGTRSSRLAPLWDLEPASNNSLHKLLFHHSIVISAADHGRHWFYADSGNVTTTLAQYSATVFPLENRAVATFAGGGTGTATITTAEDVGTLPFRDLDGWSTVVLRDYLHVAGAALTLTLRNAADDGDLCVLSVDASGNLLLSADGTTDTLIDLTATRYTFAIHLHQDGGCRVTVVDNSNTGTTQMAWSAVGGDWTPAAVGKIIIASTYDTASTVNIGNVAICETWEVVGVDSLVHIGTGISPDYPKGNNLSTMFVVRPVQAIPGGWFPAKDEWAKIGQGRRQATTILGRTGRSLNSINTNAIAHMDETRGMRFWLMDGGSVNDSSGLTQPIDTATLASEAAAIYADTDSMLTTLIPNNEAWISTMSQRPAFTGGGAEMEGYIQARNVGIKKLVNLHQSGGRIQLSDTSDVVFDGQDNIHPTLTEDIEIANEMINRLTAPARRVRNRPTRGRRHELASPHQRI